MAREEDTGAPVIHSGSKIIEFSVVDKHGKLESRGNHSWMVRNIGWVVCPVDGIHRRETGLESVSKNRGHPSVREVCTQSGVHLEPVPS